MAPERSVDSAVCNKQKWRRPDNAFELVTGKAAARSRAERKKGGSVDEKATNLDHVESFGRDDRGGAGVRGQVAGQSCGHVGGLAVDAGDPGGDGVVSGQVGELRLRVAPPCAKKTARLRPEGRLLSLLVTAATAADKFCVSVNTSRYRAC